MRLTVLAVCLPTCAAAWEFSPAPLCTLSHKSREAQIEITHDPGIPIYQMTLSLLAEPWAGSETFGIAFRGGRSLTIGTGRHRIDDRTLTVADAGFGNVLDGLEFNQTATAFTSSQSLQISLAGAAPEVRRFRSCVLQGPPIS